MKIIGDIKHANKFCVNTAENGIEWVPNLDIAKQYVSDPRNKSWYNQTIIASYEQVIKADDGKCYFKSNAPRKSKEQQFSDNLENFKKQTSRMVKKALMDYAANKGFESFLELVSFVNSGLKDYKTIAKDGLKYRDNLYTYTEKFMSRLIEDKANELTDISQLYDEYVQNFPFM